MVKFTKTELKTLLTKETVFTCSLCEEQFSTRDSALEHLSEIHSALDILKALED